MRVLLESSNDVEDEKERYDDDISARFFCQIEPDFFALVV